MIDSIDEVIEYVDEYDNDKYKSYLINTLISEPDERDYMYKNFVKVRLPIAINYSSDIPPIRDQGKQGSCACHTGATIKEYQERKNVNFLGYMSHQFLYNHRHNFDKEGMSGREVMKTLQKVGICPEVKFPESSDKRLSQISPDVFDCAERYRIKHYARIETREELKNSLVRNGPCYISLPYYGHSSKFWRSSSPDQERKGNHAVTVVGYDDEKQVFILRNSWGKNWGNSGYTYYSYEDCDNSLHNEIWTSVDDLSSTPYLTTPPKPYVHPSKVVKCCQIL